MMSSTYRTQSPDTTYEAEQVQLERLRAMSIGERFALLRSLILWNDGVVRAGVRLRYPEASEEEVAFRSLALRLDHSVMRELYGWDPERRGL